MNVIIADIQGFKNKKNEFIIKELALAANGCTQVFLVKPPYPYTKLTIEERKSVAWIERNRGIYWSQGYIDFQEFKRIIKPILVNKTVLAKGLEKIKWLRELCVECIPIDIEEKGCPKLDSLHKQYCKNFDLCCVFHTRQCSLKNVLCIREWILDKIDNII